MWLPGNPASLEKRDGARYGAFLPPCQDVPHVREERSRDKMRRGDVVTLTVVRGNGSGGHRRLLEDRRMVLIRLHDSQSVD